MPLSCNLQFVNLQKAPGCNPYCSLVLSSPRSMSDIDKSLGLLGTLVKSVGSLPGRKSACGEPPAKRMTGLFYPRSASLGPQPASQPAFLRFIVCKCVSTYVCVCLAIKCSVLNPFTHTFHLNSSHHFSLGPACGDSVFCSVIGSYVCTYLLRSGTASDDPFISFDFIASFLWALPVATQFSLVRAPPVATLVILYHRIISMGTDGGYSVFLSVRQ